ncbi:unnamed protein product [Cyclocybe aegerita]|uniref:BTB domain-containing protein n=1 Tax=Cyclocybe aegerita TaxID=1973307 RepID=A0A8S0W768_CYCAE|nr:unnamed protein product [Cyclocybe aegerita]
MSSTTLTSTMHRSQNTRPSRTPPPVATEYQPRPASQSTIVPSTSPPSSSHTPRRPSVSSTMHWLSRSSTQAPSSTAYTPTKPIKVSEPKLARKIDSLTPPQRSGTLGEGATIVRTPDEALRETGVRLTLDKDKSASTSSRSSVDKKERSTKPPKPRPVSPAKHEEPISPPTSPPLPPLPLQEEDEFRLLETSSTGSKTPSKPSRAPPPAPLSPTRRSSLKGPRSISMSTSEEPVPVPPIPAHVAASTQPPPFQPILIAEPSMIVDASKVIVTLETCTTTYRTTLTTLHSRPSHLSNYLSSLYRASDTKSVASSIYSTESDDMAMYRSHLTSQGLAPLSSNIHIFLDRPSAPYAHILSYLRSLAIEGQPDSLPRALQLLGSSPSQSRLETLIEVRDEAAYLNLEGLYKLCAEEIRHRYGPRYHHRGNSSASIHSLHASVYSLHTLLEKVETDIRQSISTPEAGVGLAARRSKQPSPSGETTAKLPPTPQSWDGPLFQRSESRQSHSNPKSAPAGWI